MKNTILNYNTISSAQFTSRDYNSKKFKQILDLPELTDSDFVEHVELFDNQTIEQISYNLYGSANFWDILILINNRDPLFGMSYEFDIIEDEAQTLVTNYINEYSGSHETETFTKLKELVLNDKVDLNEEKRTIKIIRPDKLGEFIKILNSIDFTIRNYIELNKEQYV